MRRLEKGLSSLSQPLCSFQVDFKVQGLEFRVIRGCMWDLFSGVWLRLRLEQPKWA